MNFEIYPLFVAAAVYQSIDISNGDRPADDEILSDLFKRYDELVAGQDAFYNATVVEFMLDTYANRYWERYGALLDLCAADIHSFNSLQNKSVIRASNRLNREAVKQHELDANSMIEHINRVNALKVAFDENEDTKH